MLTDRLPGALLVTMGHFGYLADGSGTKATNFLAEKIKAGGSSEGANSGTSPKTGKGKAKGGKGKGKGGYVEAEGSAEGSETDS